MVRQDMDICNTLANLGVNATCTTVTVFVSTGDVYQAPLLQKYGRPLKFYVKRKLLGPDALTKFCRFSVDDDPESEEQEQALIDLTFCQMTRRVAEESIKVYNLQASDVCIHFFEQSTMLCL